MAVVAENTLGRFRANANGIVYNNLKIVDPTTPGTPATDANAVGINAAASEEWQGVTYTGKDGVSTFFPFTKTQRPDGQKITYVVQVSEGNDALRDAILNTMEEHEVHPKVQVTGLVAAVIVTHVGSGTLESVRLDGVDQALARTPF